MSEAAVDVQHLSFQYGDRTALSDLSLSVAPGEVFGLLGPNGSGKTTLFRLLSTLIPAPPNAVKVFGRDIAIEQAAVRQMIGVVFQSPSLDKQLSARENLTHQGHLYGLRGKLLRQRIDEALRSFGLADRADERVVSFSGGMRRRVEVAKSLLHRPRLLLMDEPSTGLDPSARLDLWQIIDRVSREDGVTVLITTHLMEEADKCGRLAILAEGKVLACAAPAALKSQIGGDVVTLVTNDIKGLTQAIAGRLGHAPSVIENTLRFEIPSAHRIVPDLIEAAPGLVEAVSIGKPTLEDVFVRLTGRRLADEARPPSADGNPPVRH